MQELEIYAITVGVAFCVAYILWARLWWQKFCRPDPIDLEGCAWATLAAAFTSAIWPIAVFILIIFAVTRLTQRAA